MRRVSSAGQPRSPDRGTDGRAAGSVLPRHLVVLLATACGAAVASNYYAQPLLHTIGAALGVADATAGLLVTAGQVGYALGLAILVPLGDLLERRRLITRMLLAAAAALALAAAAPDIAVLAAALAVVGTTTVVAQIIVPMAASLAPDNQRGRVVGTVMSGLMIGVLLARIMSGLIASAAGWRAVYVVAAATILLLAATLHWALPEYGRGTAISYGALLRSTLHLVRTEPVLRQRMALGATAMGCFSILWTSVAFLLSGPPFHYGDAAIGLFGLAGLAGAVAAPVVGRLADHGHGRRTTVAVIVILLGSWGLLDLGARSLAALVAGIVLLDLGAQALHISNQSAIYALRTQARSRINTAYMVAYFVGGAAMSAAATVTYAAARWNGICALGAFTAVAGGAGWLVSSRHRPPTIAFGGYDSG
jgi:predicted MFS family arabinose efflux permease